MRYFLLLCVALFSSGYVYSHGGDKVIRGEWQNVILVAKPLDNWSTEHCIDVLETLTLTYSWSSKSAMKYNFHVHPFTENKEYRTDYFSKSDAIKAESGEIITSKPGTYCFDFISVKDLEENVNIRLKYKTN